MIKKYGTNIKTWIKFVNNVGLNNRRLNALNKQDTPTKFSHLFDIYIKDQLFGRELRRKTKENIEFLEKINCYRGIRHKNGYPVRGQRTHTNAKRKKKFKLF